MGVRLLLFHPEFDRTCSDCVKWWYYDDGPLVGTIRTRGDNKVTGEKGPPIPRPVGCDTPCYKCPKIPRGDPPVRENAVEMTDQNRKAYVHYLECRAVNQWPNDPIVRRNARLIRAILDQYDRQPLVQLVTRLGILSSSDSEALPNQG